MFASATAQKLLIARYLFLQTGICICSQKFALRDGGLFLQEEKYFLAIRNELGLADVCTYYSIKAGLYSFLTGNLWAKIFICQRKIVIKAMVGSCKQKSILVVGNEFWLTEICFHNCIYAGLCSFLARYLFFRDRNVHVLAQMYYFTYIFTYICSRRQNYAFAWKNMYLKLVLASRNLFLRLEISYDSICILHKGKFILFLFKIFVLAGRKVYVLEENWRLRVDSASSNLF